VQRHEHAEHVAPSLTDVVALRPNQCRRRAQRRLRLQTNKHTNSLHRKRYREEESYLWIAAKLEQMVPRRGALERRELTQRHDDIVEDVRDVVEPRNLPAQPVAIQRSLRNSLIRTHIVYYSHTRTHAHTRSNANMNTTCGRS
jgi:hypothetical protein